MSSVFSVPITIHIRFFLILSYIFKYFSAKCLVPPQKNCFILTRFALSLFLPEPELLPMLSLEAGGGFLLIPLLIGVEIGVDLSTPVLMILRGVLLVHVLLDDASAMISFTSGISSVRGASSIAPILWFVRGCKTETSPIVRPLNIFW